MFHPNPNALFPAAPATHPSRNTLRSAELRQILAIQNIDLKRTELTDFITTEESYLRFQRNPILRSPILDRARLALNGLERQPYLGATLVLNFG